MLSLDGRTINILNNANYLGVTIDNSLSFKPHIDKICSKLSKNIGVMYRMSYYVPETVLLNVYYSIIYPYLMYCCVAWGGAAAVHIDKLLTLQKKAVRIITHSGYLDHSDPLFRRTNLLKMPDIYAYNCCILAYKRRDSLSTPAHSHNTRIASSYYVPQFQRLGISQRSLSYTLPTLLNYVPSAIRNMPTVSTFKRHLRSELISKYSLL